VHTEEHAPTERLPQLDSPIIAEYGSTHGEANENGKTLAHQKTLENNEDAERRKTAKVSNFRRQLCTVFISSKESRAITFEKSTQTEKVRREREERRRREVLLNVCQCVWTCVCVCVCTSVCK
jgi:hypothetical protein